MKAYMMMMAALALAGCAAIPPGRIESDLARIERGIDLASALAEAAAGAGALGPKEAARIRSAVAAARAAIAMARDAAAAGDRARAEALAREAETRMESAAAAMAAGETAPSAELGEGAPAP